MFIYLIFRLVCNKSAVQVQKFPRGCLKPSGNTCHRSMNSLLESCEVRYVKAINNTVSPFQRTNDMMAIESIERFAPDHDNRESESSLLTALPVELAAAVYLPLACHSVLC